MAEREIFSSRLATIMTMAGVAIGLGNVWRFPYMMGRYGGSAFLLVYVLCNVLFAVPALMAEWALGRATRRGPLGAFTAAVGPAAGRVIGGLLLVTILVADSYYLVVIANIVYTTWFCLARGFGDGAALAAYEAGLADGGTQYVIALLVLAATLWVIHRGLRRGIEATSTWSVPFFGVVVVLLVAYTLSLPGALAQFAAFLRPDLSALGPEEIFAALGQTFFSVSLGGTFMVAYGSYMRDAEPIPLAALWTALGDAGAALLAALFIVPAILVFGLDMTAGPSLLFATLPRLFGTMPFGMWFGGLFLIALVLMAFLSNVAALEVFVGGLAEIAGGGKPGGRSPGGPGPRSGRLILVTLLLEAVLMLPSALHPPLIEKLDLVFGSGMQVLGSVLAVVGLVWGLGRAVTIGQIYGQARAGDSRPRLWERACFWWLRWVVPGALVAILVSYIHSKIR